MESWYNERLYIVLGEEARSLPSILEGTEEVLVLLLM